MRPYYQSGGITIYHGDCRDVLPGLEAEVLVTDPPYGIGFPARPTKWRRRAGAVPAAWDDRVFAEVGLLVGAAATVCIWGGNYYGLPASRGWLVWLKPDAPPSMGSCEFAWTNRNVNAAHFEYAISAANPERVGHPTQKPLAVMRWCLGRLPGGRVIDPFMGSGTTLVAAKAAGREAIGIEIEERYCAMAVERLRQAVLPLEAPAEPAAGELFAERGA